MCKVYGILLATVRCPSPLTSKPNCVATYPRSLLGFRASYEEMALHCKLGTLLCGRVISWLRVGKLGHPHSYVALYAFSRGSILYVTCPLPIVLILLIRIVIHLILRCLLSCVLLSNYDDTLHTYFIRCTVKLLYFILCPILGIVA